MKKIYFMIASLVVFAGCEPHNPDMERHINSIYAKYLVLKDDIRYDTYTDVFFEQGDSCAIHYEGNDPIKVVGGVKNVPAGTHLINLLFSEDVNDSIVYNGNVVNVYTNPKFPYYVTDNPDYPVSFTLTQDKKLLCVTKRNGQVRYYQDSENLITETNSDGEILRKMYFDNDNLILIERLAFHPSSGELVGKTEILLEDYDTNPNPLQGKYYLIGAFYRAFSKNNFTKYTINSYHSSDGVTLELTKSQTCSIPIFYDNFGYPIFGQYE